MCDNIVHAPRPLRGQLKRSLRDLDPDSGSSTKRRRLQSPIVDWLDSLVPTRPLSASDKTRSSQKPSIPCRRASSVPARFDRTQTPRVSRGLPIEEMPGSERKPRNAEGSDRGSTNTASTKIKPSHPAYQEVLEYNNVYIDRTGFKMSDDVRDFVTTNILKQRSSPPLAQEKLTQTVEDMEKWGNTTEGVLNNFATSVMWPVHNPRLGLGGNSPWARDALPYDPEWGYPLSTPIPDHAVGYARGRKSGLSREEMQVASNPHVRPYSQPATGLLMPFLVAELKSNATGGTTWHAQNQAAGSGTYAVSALEWLFEKAGIRATELDTLCFSLTASGSVVTISVHWRSSKDRAYYMSHIKGMIPIETQGVQNCNSVVKSIVEWGIGPRHEKLKEVLMTLFPLQDQWTQKRSASDAQLDEDDLQPVPPLSFASNVSRDSGTTAPTPSSAVAASQKNPKGSKAGWQHLEEVEPYRDRVEGKG